MKKPLMKSLLVAFSALLATSVVPLSSAQANDTLGQKVQYDTKAPVNDGKDISIQYWTWNDGDPAIKLAESYQKLHPNVKIEVVYKVRMVQPFSIFITPKTSCYQAT